jgi:membrane associated rhomboid family serine protease
LPAVTEEASEPWIAVFEHRSARACADAAFVLLALGIPHEQLQEQGHWSLWVPSANAAQARQELEGYWREKGRVADRRASRQAIDSGTLGALGYLLAIWALPWFEGRTVFDFRSAGALQAGATLAGEYWRALTALTLHADLAHIASNSAFGALFGTLLARQLGSGIAWLAILLAGTGGNLMNAALRASEFQSIGASTAVFGALGLLGTVVWRAGYYHHRSWRRAVAPLFAAFALFAFTGTGGLRTDVLAHLCGLVCGAALGIAISALPLRFLAATYQWAAGATAVGAIVIAWQLALRSS